ncbi:hypothetical protein [Erwinia sp. Leaf53]|uniref:hypothetical protein n=1 Tax=Erwinia sp. Leaf53 TaxID=1736225 RepID=UPI0012E13BDF|nr:hypothetical protein [Erwinia sp. Leaf53]
MTKTRLIVVADGKDAREGAEKFLGVLVESTDRVLSSHPDVRQRDQHHLSIRVSTIGFYARRYVAVK